MGRLSDLLIDVVVGMYKARATRMARYLASPIRDNLIAIHVALGAATCLPNNQWELIIQLSS